MKQPPRSRLSKRIAEISPSATLAVDAKAKELKAAGEPVIGFGAGEPDFKTPDYIVKAAQQALEDPINHRYSPAPGLPELREVVAQSTLKYSGFKIDPNQVLITNGGKQAVYQAFAALLDPGDEVILPAPYWTTYPEAVRLAGGKVVEVFAPASQNYIPTISQLDAKLSAKTKAVVLCSPSNPTGAVYDLTELQAFGKWALDRGLWVITDEIYQHLVYEGSEFISLLSAVPELQDQTLVLNGVAKTFAMTGWRVGWMSGPLDIIKGASNHLSHLTSNVNNIAQRAAIAALSEPLDSVYEMRSAFDRRRKIMLEMLNEIPGFKVPTPKGAFYAFPNVEAVLNTKIRGVHIATSADLAALILEEAKVAVVPGEAFAAPGHLRLSYALADADLITGVSRIKELLA